MTAPVAAPRGRKATWEMSGPELARVFAAHHGWGHRGAWITRPDGLAVALGWEHLARRLAARGWIRVGRGVDWRTAGERPSLPRATRSARGYYNR